MRAEPMKIASTSVRGVVKVAVIKRRSGSLPQVKSLKVDLCNLSAMGVAPDLDTPLTRENAVVCG